VDDDRRLVEACLAGDEAAGTELVERYSRMVGTVIWRATGDGASVEDLAQETFLRAFRALPEFAGRAKLSTWICTIAHRVAIDHLRKHAGNREHVQSWSGDEDTGLEIERASVHLGGRDSNPEALAVRAELDRLVRDGLARLPEKYRLPLVYAAIDGCDYETIAAMLGLPVGTVKTLIFRGKRMLKGIIDQSMSATVRDAM
jgi:RNA polymerase sigma-70 factor (ECF subfamily)